MIKSLAMVVLGLLLGIVGTDVNTGIARFSFGIPELTDGIGFIVVAVGVFAVGEIVANLGDLESGASVHAATSTNLMPTLAGPEAIVLADRARHRRSAAFFGVLPGTGPAIASFAVLHAREEDRARSRRASARARSRAWPGPRPPTTPTRSASSSRC